MTLFGVLRLAVLAFLAGCCHGNEDDVISHLILLDQMPHTVATNATPELIIRTNYSGKIEFREAESFKVLLNITAPSIEDAYAVSSELTDNKGTLLLQVYEKTVAGPTFSLQWIFVLVFVLSGIVFLITLVYVIWWYSRKKHLDIYGPNNYLDRHMYRSRNSMLLGAAAGELLGEQDEDELDGDDDNERRKMDKLRVSMKPETIIEESEESCDDDRTNPKLRFQVPVSHVQRQRSFRQGTSQLSNENVHGSGILDYPDQSGDELENDLSPERKVADADGCYTPLDDIDDIWHENVVSNSQSTAKLADPRGNLDYNIQTSKSDGDLLGDNKKLSEKEKVIIPPVKLDLPAKQKRSPGKAITVPKRAEPNVYQRGLNLQVRRQENDLSSSPRRADKIRAQVHTPEHQYANNSFGHYIELKTPESQLSKSRTSRESNDAYELYTYPADIPMSTFKAANTSPVKESPVYQVPKKPKPVFQSGSPTNFDFNKLDPKLPTQAPNEPYSPGKFSMLSEGSGSDDLSDIVGNDSHGNRGYMELADSDLDDLDPPSPDHNINADQISNASLPLPSPPPMSNQFMPYDTHGQISQLSPRQSLVTPLDSKDYGTCIALTGSPSPGGPYSQGAEKRFVFPPPPSMYTPPQHGAWAKRELDFTNDPNAGDYAGLPMNMQAPPHGLPPAPPPPLEDPEDGRGDRKHGKRERRTSGGESVKGERERRKSGSERDRKPSFGKKGKIPKHLHLTIIMSVCVLSVISGVYSISTPEDITVDIVVYVPPSYPYKNSTIYSAPGKHVKVKDSYGMKWFVSPDPILTNPDKTKCIMVSCEHGCDDNTGQCICRHGYNMKNGKCIDINECLTGMIQCPHPQAGCANKDGSYECLCMSSSNTLYKYEDLCLDCRDPCPDGKYEIQPCKGNNKKICKECTQYCGDNFYMEIPCAERSDAVCYMCKPKCDINYEFEFSQCSATQNRECKDKVRLPSPSMSSNVILDDLAAPNDKEMQIPYQPLDGDYPGFVMKRGLNGFGSEFWIQAQVRESQPVVLFKPVDHSEDMSNTDYTGDDDILNKYCKYPLPAMYDLKYIKHEDVFYKDSDSYNDDTLLPCESDPGSFPGNKGQQPQTSILCSEPGILSDVFLQIDPDDYKSTESVWVEKDRRCQQRHETCENCSRSCIIQMNAGGRTCAVTADDDSGRSARIPTCVTCCTRDNCTNKCKNYHNNRCRMIRCQKGSLVEFELNPIYPTDGSYYCHIEPVLGQRLLRIEYEVGMKKNSEPLLYKGDLSLYTDTVWQKTGKIQGRDSIIHAEIDSQIETMPIIVKGAAGVINVKVGTYSVQGEPLLSTVSGVNNISVQPDKPFGISPKQFGTKGCGDNTPDWESVVTSRNEFFEKSDDLVSIYQGDSTYLVSNKSKAKLRIGLNGDTSLLKAVLSPTKVIYDTLQADMSMNGTHWILLVKGETVSCPGVFSLNLSDPNYLQVPIYQFDVGIECPKQFQLNFTIPTGDARELSKDYQLQIQDVGGSFILRIHTVGRFDEYGRKYDKGANTNTDTRTIQTPNELRTEPTHFSILFISVVLGATILLLFLLLFGLAWKQGIPGGDIQRFRIRHLVLLVVYITVQFIYSLFVSMTVFCLIIIAVNGETSTFLKQYNQQRSVTTALSQLELDIMEQHLFSELTRQNEEAAHRKHDCKLTIDMVISDVERLQTSLESQTMNSIRKSSIKNLITEHADTSFQQFSRDIIKFRDSYSKYEHFVVNKLNTELESTYKSIQKSQWLRGANYLYNTVSNNKVLMNDGDVMMPFMQWVNMDTDVMNLAKGLRLSLPDLPDLSRESAALPINNNYKNNNNNKIYGTLSKPRQFSTQTVNKWFVQPDIPKPDLSRNETFRDENTKKVSTLDPSSYSIFLVGMIIIDIFWLLHRMIKACGVGKLLLLGYPIYVDVRENKEGPNNEEVKKVNKKPCFSKFRNIANRVLSTLFIPKLIGTIFICLMVYSINIVADKFINRETFRYLGYHNDMEDLMSINGNAINKRIESHSERINKVEYKMYEDVTNVNIQNHQFVLNLVETQWKKIETTYAKTYCEYLNKINVTARCEDSFKDNKLSHVRPDRCTFPPVQPVLYKRNETSSGKIAGVQLDGFLYNIRKMISDTCYIVVIYLSCVVIKELLGTVLWIYIKRSGFVSLRIIYETDEAPGSANSSTTNK
ncbi:hypothetical protein ACF0H5_020281 [Mactra antiquata]